MAGGGLLEDAGVGAEEDLVGVSLIGFDGVVVVRDLGDGAHESATACHARTHASHAAATLPATAGVALARSGLPESVANRSAAERAADWVMDGMVRSPQRQGTTGELASAATKIYFDRRTKTCGSDHKGAEKSDRLSSA